MKRAGPAALSLVVSEPCFRALQQCAQHADVCMCRKGTLESQQCDHIAKADNVVT
jgi:hypothetical protein